MEEPCSWNLEYKVRLETELTCGGCLERGALHTWAGPRCSGCPFLLYDIADSAAEAWALRRMEVHF